MKYLDFEKHIKKEFENSKEPVQMDALLSSLDLGKQPKSKGFAFWMIIPFLILTFSVLAWKFVDVNNYKGDDLSHTNKEGVSSSEGIGTDVYNNFESTIVQNNSSQTLQNENPLTPQQENTLASQNESAQAPQGESALTSQNESTLTSIDESTLISDDDDNNRFSTETNGEVFGTPFTIKTTKITKNKNTNSDTDSNNNSIPANSAQTNYKSQSAYPIQSGRSIDETDLNAVLSQPSESTNSLNSGNVGNSSASIGISRSRTMLSFDQLDQSIGILDESEIDGNLFTRMKINCPSFENPSWHMALIPEVGIFLPKKTLSPNSFDESPAYLKRLDSESTLEGIQLGLYGMVVRDNIPFYLKAGLSYSRITERMELEYEYTRKDTMEGIVSTTVSGNGDTTIHIKGDIVTETLFKGSNRQHHYIHLFDVPISIGYTTYIAGLDVGIEGGVKVNFMTRATGNLLTSENEYTNLSLNRLFKNRVGLSYFGGLMIGRNFGRFGDIYIAPRFTYYPDDFSNQNNSVSQKYFTIGLNAGVVYKIN